MSLVGKIRVTCPGCGTSHDCELVQSINTDRSPALRERLLAGEINMLTCECGRRVQLAGNLLFHDPGAHYLCQVCPGGEEADRGPADQSGKTIDQAAAAFRASGATGTLRLVPSQNALIEKVKILDAGLDDWAVELVKVLLLASLEIADLDRIVLFDRVDGDQLRWVMFEDGAPVTFSSPKVAYENLRRERATARPSTDELQIDRRWAVEALRKILREPN